jgi:hypothetical protein
MSTAYILGAGASHGFGSSASRVRPPLAAGFFEAYSSLPISGDLGVKVGWVVNYVRDRYGVPVEKFGSFRMDAEEFMTTLETGIEQFTRKLKEGSLGNNSSAFADEARTIATFDQTLFLFTHILNEIANGSLYEDYIRLAQRLRPGDVVVTFNWDTLLDRVLYEVIDWVPDNGYGIRFHSLFEEGWRAPAISGSSSVTFLKLHGSTNWLTRYMSRSIATGERTILTSDPKRSTLSFNVETGEVLEHPRFEGKIRVHPHSATQTYDASMLHPLCFVTGKEKFDAFHGRFRPGYAPFTYFYSPLDPEDGVPTSPLIIAPVRHKAYDDYGSVLDPLWSAASGAIARADRIVVIGFSFAPTDTRAQGLLKPEKHKRLIEIVDPNPERPFETIQGLVGDSATIVRAASSFNQYTQQ